MRERDAVVMTGTNLDPAIWRAFQLRESRRLTVEFSSLLILNPRERVTRNILNKLVRLFNSSASLAESAKDHLAQLPFLFFTGH
jgi:hypothetical protein